MIAGLPIIRMAALLLLLLVPAGSAAAASDFGQSEPGAGSHPDGNRPAAGSSPKLIPVQYCRYGVARLCATTYGACYLGGPLCVGDPCYCPSAYGPVWGVAR